MHANFASILGTIFERCWVQFGSENGAKMDTKFYVFGQCFFDTLFWFCGRCFLKFSHVFASCYDVIFDAEHRVFLKFFDFALCKINWKSEAKHFKNRTQNDQKIDAKWCPNRLRNRSFFWTPFGDAWRPRFWAGFEVDLGLGPFCGQKSVWKRLGKSSKKWQKKNDAGHPRATREAWPVVP